MKKLQLLLITLLATSCLLGQEKKAGMKSFKMNSQFILDSKDFKEGDIDAKTNREINKAFEDSEEFESKVEEEIRNAGLSFDNDAIWGDNGPERIEGARFMFDKLAIVDSVLLVHPEGASKGIAIISKQLTFNEAGKIYSESDLTIYSHYADGFIDIINIKGKDGMDAEDVTFEPEPMVKSVNGANGANGDKAHLRCRVFPPKCSRTHAVPGAAGRNGANGKIGLEGEKGYDGGQGADAGNITFLAANYGSSSFVTITAIGGEGGDGGRGGKGGKGGDAGNGGNGGMGGDADHGMSSKPGGAGGRGGNGGDGGRGGIGGNGGNGGRGGDITLFAINPYGLPIAEILNNQGGKGGLLGLGGEGGVPGQGGIGGSGGQGGRGKYLNGSKPNAPNGSNGLPGKKGMDGDNGRRGGDGLDGNIIRRPRREVKSITVEDGIGIIRSVL